MSFLSVFTRAPSSLVRPVTRALSVSAQLFQDSRSKVLFVGGLSFNTSRAALQEPFQEYGHVESTRIVTDRATGRSKGFGYIEFDSEDSAQKALNALNNSFLDGRNIRLDFALARDDAPPRVHEPSNTLFFGNIPTHLDGEALGELLTDSLGSPLGASEVRLIPGRADFDTGAPPTVNRGFGFLQFDSIEKATQIKEALEKKILEGWTMEGVAPKIGFEAERRPRTDRGSSSFGGRSGGFGGARDRSFGGDRGGFGRDRGDFGDRAPRRDFGRSDRGGREGGFGGFSRGGDRNGGSSRFGGGRGGDRY